MSSQKYSCSACHAPLEVANRFEKTAKCPYCGTVNFLINDSLDLSGHTGEIYDSASIFQVGNKIKFSQGEEEISGIIQARVRYEYDEGLWEEFFIQTMNNQKIWLQEDEGELTLFKKKSLTKKIPPVEEIFAGSVIPVNNQDFFVTEKIEANIQGVQGSLPYKIKSKEKITCIDGNISGKLASLEITPSEIFYCEGQEIGYDEIKVL